MDLDLLVNIISLRRSGMHAVAGWIYEQIPEPKHFVNNRVLRQRRIRRPKRFNNIESLNGAIIVNEDFALTKDISSKIAFENESDILGKIGLRRNVLVLRHPLNYMASVLKCPRQWAKPIQINWKHRVENWKLYAREYLGDTSFLPHKVCVSFDRWFANRKYRKKISKQLRLKFTDKGKNTVGAWGGGSSFDGLIYKNSAERMDVLARWKQVLHVKRNRKIFRYIQKDVEVIELCSRMKYDLTTD